MNRSKTLNLTLLLALVAIFGTDCARTRIEPTPPPSFRLAVLDFAVPAEWRKPDIPDAMNKELRGWWFSSRGIFQNPGLGREAGDLFALQLSRLPFISLVSRTDVKYYMATKLEQIQQAREAQRRQLEASANPDDLALAEKIRTLTPADYEVELERLNPPSVGRELNADRVLIGRLHNAHMGHNRTIGWYWAVVDVEVSLVDVDTGRVLWNRRAAFRKNFASTSLLLEEAAKRMVDLMKREHFYQPR